MKGLVIVAICLLGTAAHAERPGAWDAYTAQKFRAALQAEQEAVENCIAGDNSACNCGGLKNAALRTKSQLVRTQNANLKMSSSYRNCITNAYFATSDDLRPDYAARERFVAMCKRNHKDEIASLLAAKNEKVSSLATRLASLQEVAKVVPSCEISL